MSETTSDNPKNPKRLGRGLGSLFGEANSRSGAGSIMDSTPARTGTIPGPAAKAPAVTSSISAKPNAAPAQASTTSAAATSAQVPPTANAGPAPASASASGASTQTSSTTSEKTAAASSLQAPIQAQVQTPNIPSESRVWKIEIHKLKPSPFQPRNYFEKDKLEELAQSIKQSGVIQPIVARKTGTAGYEIIAGERRWRAAQIAGLHEVPVVLKELDDRATLEMAIIENVQREDLNPIEEAEAYQRLAQEFELTQQQVAEKVGKERATVANAVRLLQLPYEVREMVAKQEITQGHAKVLLGIDNAFDQKKWANQVLKENLTVRKLEKMLKKDDTKVEPDADQVKSDSVKGRLINGLTEELQKLLGTKVAIDYTEGKGKLSINFYTDDQLTSVIDRIRAGCQK